VHARWAMLGVAGILAQGEAPTGSWRRRKARKQHRETTARPLALTNPHGPSAALLPPPKKTSLHRDHPPRPVLVQPERDRDPREGARPARGGVLGDALCGAQAVAGAGRAGARTRAAGARRCPRRCCWPGAAPAARLVFAAAARCGGRKRRKPDTHTHTHTPAPPPNQDFRNPGSVDADPLFPNNKLPAHEVGYPGGIFAPFVVGGARPERRRGGVSMRCHTAGVGRGASASRGCPAPCPPGLSTHRANHPTPPAPPPARQP
jgi:hypothetical protein